MPELIKRKCRNPDTSLDEQDLKDIAEAEEDILKGRVYSTKELRAKLGIQYNTPKLDFVYHTFVRKSP